MNIDLIAAKISRACDVLLKLEFYLPTGTRLIIITNFIRFIRKEKEL